MSEFAVQAPQRLAASTDLAGPGSVALPHQVTRASAPAGTDQRPGPVPLPWPIAALVAAGSGLLLALAFPGFDAWPLAPVAVACWALAVRGRRARPAGLLGLVAGLTFTLIHLHWSGVYVGVLPWVALSTLEALYLAAMSALLPLAWRVPGAGWAGRAGTVLAVTGLWVAQEAARGRTPFGGFPWARVAFSQADSPLLGFAALGGAPAVTAAVAAVGGCLAVLLAAVLDRVVRLRDRRSWLLPAGALLGAVGVFAAGAAVPRPTDATRYAQVAAVQGNVPTAGLEFNAQRRAVLDNHARATRDYAAQLASGGAPRPDLVVWPENASDIDPLRNRDAAAVIDAAAAAVRVPIVLGAVLAEPVGYVSNASIVWGPAGSATPGPGARYVKRHPAPFAEYIPFRSFFRHFSDKVDLVSTDFAAGHSVGVLPVNGVKLGDVICFEVAYDDLVRDPVAQGAELLTVQTNNATFGYTDESVQQLAMSRLRAVESGRSVIHISTVGVSALIAPDGTMVTRSGHFTQQVLTARLPLRTQQTVATRVGALPEIVIAALGLLLVAAAALRPRLRRRAAVAAGAAGSVPQDSAQDDAAQDAAAQDDAAQDDAGQDDVAQDAAVQDGAAQDAAQDGQEQHR